MNRNILKSTGAVFAGVITIVALSIATDFALAAIGLFPPIGTGAFLPWMLGVALLYRSAYTVAGGYVTTMLAPRGAIRHVIILGIIGTIFGVAGAVAGWKLPHHWYPIALVVIALPLAWLGGRLRMLSH